MPEPGGDCSTWGTVRGEIPDKEELAFTSATRLVYMIARKKLPPVELMDATLARAVSLNPRLNAICTWTADQARGRAKNAKAAVMKGENLGPLCKAAGCADARLDAPAPHR